MSQDRLSHLLARLSLSAGVFHVGTLCGSHELGGEEHLGHVHVVRAGAVRIIGGPAGGLTIVEPTLLFMPRGGAHRLVAHDGLAADVVCASIRFGTGGPNPVSGSLPPLVLIPLAALRGAAALLEVMYEEAFAQEEGRQASLDRLCELLLIRVLRHSIEQGLASGGVLSGLADPRLRKAMTAMHADPAHPWELSEMAALAGMSRARFAQHFRTVTGETPASYLAGWRISLAQAMLRNGRPLKTVADEVGYGSPSALTRAFARRTAASPREWLRHMQGPNEDVPGRQHPVAPPRSSGP